jgi:hypothetical protein
MTNEFIPIMEMMHGTLKFVKATNNIKLSAMFKQVYVERGNLETTFIRM